jgi:HAMP domain-containing protein
VRLFKANSPEGVGKSFKDNRDPNGVYVNRDLVKVAKDGTHYLQYSSPLPGNNVLVPKLGYTEYLAKWDMAVGTSVNLDGIEAQVAVVEAKVQERMEGVMLSIVGVAVVVLLVIAAAGMLLANTILRPLNLMKANLDDIAAGEGDLTRRLTITSQDELGELAGSFNRFVDKIHGLVRQITEMTTQLTWCIRCPIRPSVLTRPWSVSVTRPIRSPRRSTKCRRPLRKWPKVRRTRRWPRSRPTRKARAPSAWWPAASCRFMRWWTTFAAAACPSTACSRTCRRLSACSG